MKKLKLYIETSVWGFLFADDNPEKMRDTIRFFEEIRRGDYELFISEMVMTEIRRAPKERRNELLGKIDEFEPEELEITEEVDELALKYAKAYFMPERAFDDLIHAAVATVTKAVISN